MPQREDAQKLQLREELREQGLLPPSKDSQSQVDHPSHYGGDTVYEAIRVIEAWGLGFHLGNAVKYIARAGRKDPTREREDLLKARWYLDRKIEELSRAEQKAGAQRDRP